MRLEKESYDSWTLESLAHIKAFKAKLLAQNPEAEVSYEVEEESDEDSDEESFEEEIFEEESKFIFSFFHLLFVVVFTGALQRAVPLLKERQDQIKAVLSVLKKVKDEKAKGIQKSKKIKRSSPPPRRPTAAPAPRGPWAAPPHRAAARSAGRGSRPGRPWRGGRRRGQM